MSLFHILVLGVGTGLAGWLARGRSRGWVLLTGSILAIYWLQPSTPVRNLDFWLPTATVGLAALAWAFTRPSSQPLNRQDWLTILITCGVILAISALRYVGPLFYLTPTRPPALLQVLLAISGYTLIFFVVRWIPGKSGWLYGLFSFILLLFLILKTDAFAQAASAGLRLLVGQDAALATPFDIRWLGFSYTSFR
ncbi:MAG: hypothetical protein JW726_05805, partial [Anaerolineales bacterium]|nr:hypothetical protein [Anaerolineales bacterium]